MLEECAGKSVCRCLGRGGGGAAPAQVCPCFRFFTMATCMCRAAPGIWCARLQAPLESHFPILLHAPCRSQT